MQQNQKQSAARNRGVRGRQVRVSRPNAQVTQAAQLGRLTRVTDEPIEVNKNGQNGRSVVRLDTGPYTYRAIPFGVRSEVDLGTDSYPLVGGGFQVRLDALSKYISEVRLEANGAPMQEWDVDELNTINDFYDLKFHGGFSGFHFPGEEMFTNQRHRDLFALGTANLKNLKLVLRQTSLFDPATMDIVCQPHFVKQARPATFVNTTEVVSHTFTGVGKHTFKDLPDGDDMQAIWIKGEGISHVKLEVDGVLLIDTHISGYKSYLHSVNRDKDSLDNNWLIDFMAEGEPTALAALDLPAELRRGADVKLELTTTNASTPVKFITVHVGPYHKVR